MRLRKINVLEVSAQTDAQMHADILSWSQGLFAGVALEGATLLLNRSLRQGTRELVARGGMSRPGGSVTKES